MLKIKQCTKCSKYKPIQGFGTRSRKNSDGSVSRKPKSHCRDCVNSSNLKRYHGNKNTKEAHKRASYKSRLKGYGVTPDKYEELWEVYGGRCHICKGMPEKLLCIDHCHSTGKVRGLLCNSCNLALGYAKDNVGILNKMAEYLEMHNEKFYL